jgi:formate hydrogenlyase subunit 3/multisubunit Na+/H+ antiporter MnhD subunit
MTPMFDYDKVLGLAGFLAVYALIGLAGFYALWIFYLAVMNLKRARDAGLLNKTARVLGLPVLIVGYVLDAVLNIVFMTLVFLELPEELTVTARLKRHIKDSQGWELALACWFIPLLDPFDPSGSHITEEAAP